jgi:hypothetical protein
MLALPECGLLASWNITLPPLVVSHPQMTGVFPPHPPCSKPAFGTTFAPSASADTGNAKASAPSARVIGSLMVISSFLSNALRGVAAPTST